MISIHHLTLPYHIKRLSCQFPDTGLIGILGANGAGKSTLLKTLAGLITPVSGEIVIQQKLLNQFSHAERSQLMAYLPQSTPIHWSLTVYDCLVLGLDKKFTKKTEQQRIVQYAKDFSLTHLLSNETRTLSGGELARLHLARCCIKQTPILLADEPIASLDPYYQIDIMERLKMRSKTTCCIIVLHDLSLAYQFCDEVILMKNGTIIAAGATDAVILTENLVKAFSISATIDSISQSIYNIQKNDDEKTHTF